MHKAIKWNLYKIFGTVKFNLEKFIFIGSMLLILLSTTLVILGYKTYGVSILSSSSWMIYWAVFISFFISLINILPIFRDSKTNSISMLAGIGVSKRTYIMSKVLFSLSYMLIYSILTCIFVFGNKGVSFSFSLQYIITSITQSLSIIAAVFMLAIIIANHTAFITVMGISVVLITFPLMSGVIEPIELIDASNGIGYLFILQFIFVWLFMNQFSIMANVLRWNNESLKNGKIDYMWSLKSAWEQLRRPRDKKR